MPAGIPEPSTGQFRNPRPFLAKLDPEVAASLVTAAADVVLVIDRAGVIRDVAFGSEDLNRACRRWVGKAWLETVTPESRPKVEAMLDEFRNGHRGRWRQVVHASADGSGLPLSYVVLPVFRPGRRTPPMDGSGLAFGRDLRAQTALQQRLVAAQLSIERGYWRLRQVEALYRQVSAASSDGVLIVDAETEKLEEANPAAYRFLGDAARRSGWTLTESFPSASRTTVQRMLARLRAGARADSVFVRLVTGPDKIRLSASLLRHGSTIHFLLLFTGQQQADPANDDEDCQLMAAAAEQAPDGFVVTDLHGRVLRVNRAFLELAELSSEESVRGESLERWLGRTNVDLNVLTANLRQRGAVRLFATTLRGESGTTVDVEISAAAVSSGEQRCLGFAVRETGLRLVSEGRAVKDFPRSAGQMTELVGRVPLKDIVRETTDLIERLCIDAALELTGDNRASAAEMLGLSRQSLYVKLRRFGIGDTVLEQ